jgi:hypothetical protein
MGLFDILRKTNKVCVKDIVNFELGNYRQNYHVQYAYKYNNGIISDNELDIEKIAYTDDNLYDIVADAIGDFYINNREHIPYKINPNIHH